VNTMLKRVRANYETDRRNEVNRELRVQKAILKLSLSGGDADDKVWESAALWQSEEAEPLPSAVQVVGYLRVFGYDAVSADTWGPNGISRSGQDQPQIRLHLDSHIEKAGHSSHIESHFTHTWYVVQCSLDLKRPQGQFEWQAPRRLAQLRVGLHDPLKALDAGVYSEFFGGTPFAQHGGLRGTTARLQAWLASLSNLLNGEKCTPAAVALIMKFLLAHEVIKKQDMQRPAQGQPVECALDQACLPEDSPTSFEATNPS